MTFRSMCFVVLLLVCTAGAASAQPPCFGDDGFAVPGACCVPVSAPALPPFPAMTLPAEGCCFLDCGIEAVFPMAIFLGAPAPLFCDVYVIPATFIGGPSIQTAFFVAKYARTWVEANATGTVGRQVWRFLVNTDLVYLPPFAPPCPTPRCAALGNLPVHFFGSVDYAEDCLNPGTWSMALNLTHFCGDLAHGALSQRPTPFSHPERLFAFVAPTPFDWTNPGPPPTGIPIADAVRSTQANLNTLTWNCQSEVPLNGGQSIGLAMTCECSTSSSAPARWSQLDIRLLYGCTTPPAFNFGPIPWPPIVPTGYSSFPLGTYNGPPGSYPAGEAVSVGFGLAAAPDPCGFNFPFHFTYGVSTAGGDFGILFNHPAGSDRFLDLESCLVFVNTPPFMILGYGSLFLSPMVWSVNF